MTRSTCWWTLLALSGTACSLIVPGNGGFTPDRVDAGQQLPDGGRDGGPPDRDGGSPDRDAGPSDAGTDAGPICGDGLMACGGACADVQTDTAHCGGCDNACASTDVCREGACFDPVRQVAAAATHACLVRASGAVLCWGTNDFGQLGTGDFTWSTEPRVVVDVDDAIGISAGALSFGGFNGRTCVTRGSGQAWCWGSGTNRPARVDTLTSVLQTETGHALACARRAPVPQVSCWGQLHPGGTIYTTPTAISGLPPSPTRIDVISVGTGHACALDELGALSCWGGNGSGAIGDGTTDDTAIARAVGLTDIAEVVTGIGYTCARERAGQVWCWGSAGQIGTGMSGFSAVPTPQQVTTIPDATRIFAGSITQTTCALRPEGSLWCWGIDIVESARAGTSVENALPVQLLGIGPIVDLAIGLRFACALRSSGDVDCWGDNQRGQLGDGTTENRLTPVRVMLP